MKEQFIKYKMPIFISLNLLMTIGMNLGHPVTPTLLKDLNLGSHVFGISFAAMCTTNFIFALVWSNVAHTMKKSRILMISSLGYAVAQIMFGFANSEMMIYAARLLSGVFAGGFQVGFMAYIVNEAPEEKQASYITYSSIIVSVGAALGFFVGGFIGDISIQLTFIVQALVHIVLGLVLYLILGPMETIEEYVDWSMIKKSNPLKIIKDARPILGGYTLIVLVSVFVSSIGTTLFDQSFNYYVKDIFNFLPSQSGMVKFATGIMAIILNAWILRRKPKNKSAVLKTIFVMMATLALFVGFSSKVTPFIVLSLLWFGAYTLMIPVIQNLVISQRKNVHEGNQLSGVYNALMMSGKIFGALLTSFVYSMSPIATFWVAGLIFIASFLIVQIPKKV